MVLEADVAASRETFYFAPWLRFPINDLFIVDLDSDVVVDKGDSHAIPLAGALGRHPGWRLGVVDGAGLVDAVTRVVDLNFPGVINVGITSWKAGNADENT